MAKLLIVEDDELNREMLIRRFTRKGYGVILACDGLQGLKIAQAEQPDLILMDVTLPVMSGYEATRQLKADITTQNIPVIALSAHAMESEREEALKAGCDEYETKPIAFERLFHKIESLLVDRPRQTNEQTEDTQLSPSQKATE